MIAANVSQIFSQAILTTFPPLDVRVSEWADKHRVLSSGPCAEPGPWRTSRVPYLRGIMDACDDPAVESVVVKKPARSGGTMAALNFLGQRIDNDPAPALWVWPTLDDARKFSETELDAMLRDCPTLAAKINVNTATDTDNRRLRKVWPGGSVLIVGSESASALSGVTVCYVFGSDADRFAGSARNRAGEDEGDPWQLALVRSTTFPQRRKSFLESSPSIHGRSLIQREYEKSDKRIFEVPCPRCGELQELVWGQVRWDSDDSPVYYVCAYCSGRIEHSEKPWMVAAGEWRATAPFTGIAGFAFNFLVTPWRTWDDGRKKLVEAKKSLKDTGNKQELKVFINTWLAQEWKEGEEQAIEVSDLEARQEKYHCECPDGVLVIACSADVQQDRIEVARIGYGVGRESWWLDYDVLTGDPAQSEVWQKLERVWLSTYQASHGMLRPQILFVDAGDGNRTQEVYDWCKSRQVRRERVFAIKGSSKPARPILTKETLQGHQKVRHYEIGTNAAKDRLSARLTITEPGPGFVHFPEWDGDRYQHFTSAFFEQFRREQPTPVVSGGRQINVWRRVGSGPLEAWDCWTYAEAALERLNPDFAKLEAARLAALREQLPKQETPATIRRPVRQSTFLRRWK